MRYKQFWKPRRITLVSPSKIKLNTPNFLTIKPIPKHPNKDLSFPEAKKRYGLALSPLGDWDKDKVINMLDCRPFDPLRHKIPEEHKRKRIFSYSGGYITIGKAWDKILYEIPHLKWSKKAEEENSRAFLYSTLKRKEVQKKIKESPFKDIVGTYTIKNVHLNNNQVMLVRYYLHKYLKSVHPNKEFLFRDDNPSKVDVRDLETGKLYENRKISTYFNKSTPSYIRNLLSLLAPHTSLTIVITDNPIDIIKKSAYLPKKIKEKCKENPSERYSSSKFVTTCETVAREVLGETRYYAQAGPYSDIMNWNAIAWFFSGDKPSGMPLGRVMLRWGTVNGKWSGKKDIGIAFYPGKKYMGDYKRYHYPLSEGGLGWESDYGARGFYGPLSADMGRGLVGELQKILLKKGYYTHIIHTPYKYHGYDDLRRTFTHSEYNLTDALKYYGKKLHMGPIPIQKPTIENTSITDAKADILSKDKIPSPLMLAMANDTSVGVRVSLARREDLPPSVKETLIRSGNPQIYDAIIENPSFELTDELTDKIIARGDAYNMYSLVKSDRVPKPKKIEATRIALKHIAMGDSDRNISMETIKEYLLKYGKTPSNPIRKEIINDTSKKYSKLKMYLLEKCPEIVRTLTPSEIDKLLHDNSSDVVIKVISLVKLTPKQFHELVRHPSANVRYKMAKLKRLSDEDMLVLAKDGEKQISDRILLRKTIGPKTMRYILSSYNPESDAFHKLLKRKPFTDSELKLVLNRPDINVHMLNALVNNEHLTEKQRLEVLKKFIDTEDASAEFIHDFISNPEIYNYILKVIKDKPILRTIIANIENLPLSDDKKSRLYATVSKYANVMQKSILLKNPDVSDEIKNIIRKELRIVKHRRYY